MTPLARIALLLVGAAVALAAVLVLRDDNTTGASPIVERPAPLAPRSAPTIEAPRAGSDVPDLKAERTVRPPRTIPAPLEPTPPPRTQPVPQPTPKTPPPVVDDGPIISGGGDD
jgi:hypothetical protein